MTLHIFEPANLAERNAGHLLAREGLMVDIGGVGLVGVDLCRSPAARGRILSLKVPTKILHSESALWVHTGLHTPALSQGLNVSREITPGDVVVIGGLKITSLERTALDLLIRDEESGIEYMCALIRAGTSVDKIYALATERSLSGIVHVRTILKQLPPDFGVWMISRTP